MSLEEKKKEYITLERADGEPIELWREITLYEERGVSEKFTIKNILKIIFGGRTIRFLCKENDEYIYYIFHGEDIKYMKACLNGLEGLIL